MRKNYFQNVKIADKLKMIMKAIFAILLVNNILFAILMLVFWNIRYGLSFLSLQ